MTRQRFVHRVWILCATALVLVASACTGASRPQAADEILTEAAETAAPTATDDPTSSAPPAANGNTPVSRGEDTVAAPAPGAPLPESDTDVKEAGPRLYSGAADTLGITDDKIVICAHAALTYAAAFNTSADDLNVYWEEVNAKGGVNGRQVEVTYENDNYSGPDAIAAAERCKAKKPSMIIGGIGFDQIPGVRDWAETNKYLYVHHTATMEGSAGKNYSFTALPSTEKTGEMFAELALWKFKNKKIGIIGRDSLNWVPGIKAFKKKAAGKLNIVKEVYTPKDHHNYSLEISQMQAAGAEVVWGWESALATLEMIQQAKSVNYSPQWMVFPFNLQSQTLGAQALNPPVIGLAMFNSYSYHDYSGEFAKYGDDIKAFERQYAKYRPNVDLEGVGGDLLFLNWQGMKGLHGLLASCGRDCTRNKIADVIRTATYDRSGSVCGVDFTRPGHTQRGGWQVSVMQAYQSPSGRVNFRNIATCKEHLI